MSNEARIDCGLQVRVGNLSYLSQPTSFNADISVANGPSPGCITAHTYATNVDLSQLAQPGLCRLINLDEDNTIEVGIHDGVLFHPFMDLLPGESYVVRLSAGLGGEEAQTGTGTEAVTNHLAVRGRFAACNLLVECFDT